MTMTSGFHNSINGDRKYYAEDMNRPYKDIVSNGVFPNPSTQLQVLASSGMTVSVSTGGGLFGNGWAYNDAPVLLTCEASEATLSRIDAIVVKRDDSESVRDTILYVKKGTPSQSPVRPEMTHDDYVDEYCLATIEIAPGTTAITQSLITDTRPDTTVCGWVTGLIDQVDTSTLFSQWQSAYSEQYDAFMDEFETWWAGVRAILQDDETASAQILLLTQEKADRKKTTVQLTVDGWIANDDGYYYQTATISGLGANDIVLVASDPSTLDAWGNGGVVCTTQAEGSLTFRANVAVAVTANIINMGS